MPNAAARVLLQFSRIVAEASGRDILPLLARAATEHVGANASAVVEIRDSEQLVLVASSGLPPSLFGWSTEAEVIGVELGEALKAATGGDFADAHVLPMTSGGSLFGALVLLLDSGARLLPERLELADGLVDLAATALGQLAQIDELTRAHAELRASQDLLVRTEKLRALGEMAAGINHDLKNILNPISAHVDLLSRALERGDIEKCRASLESVRSVVAHGSDLLETLRRFSRDAPQQEPELTDLNRLAREAIEVARARASSSGGPIEFVAALGDPPVIAARPSEIVSALVNLIVNAVDAMPAGGSIVVRTGEAREGAFVDVEDEGPGMPEDVASRVFEPFFTTKGEAGTGLGLAMVRGCVERHGGAVALHTRPGAGTKISLWFPAARESDFPAERDTPELVATRDAAQRLAGSRVLVIEDDPLSRAATCEILSEEGYDVRGVATGKEALSALCDVAGEFDLVVTDLGLPDVRGTELVRRIRAERPAMGVVALTGRSTEDPEVSRLLELPRVRFVQKPLDIDVLLRTIESVR